MSGYLVVVENMGNFITTVVFHLVVDGQCKENLETINGLIAHKVTKAPSAMFLLVPTLFILKSLSLKKLGSTYNQACSFILNNFSHHVWYFSMFRGLILDQHMPKESFSLEWQTNLLKL
jgi:hypothetical protein